MSGHCGVSSLGELRDRLRWELLSCFGVATSMSSLRLAPRAALSRSRVEQPLLVQLDSAALLAVEGANKMALSLAQAMRRSDGEELVGDRKSSGGPPASAPV